VFRLGEVERRHGWGLAAVKVVSSGGHLGDYGGGLDMKERLLFGEGAIDG